MSVRPDLQDWVRNYLASRLVMAPDAISFDRTLAEYGLDSVDAIYMAGELEEAFGLDIDPATFIQFGTIAAMIAALAPSLRAAAQPAPP